MDPVKVPQKTITSTEVPNMGGGQFLKPAQNGPVNAFIDSKDVELTAEGYLIPRRKLLPFLPDTIETTYEKAPMLMPDGSITYFTLDHGKAVYAKEGDASWTIISGGSNSYTTNNGGMPTFLRVLDNVLVLNGKNGDRLSYVDLTAPGFSVVKYVKVNDPTTAPTSALTNLTTGAFNVYYAYTYSGQGPGETALSPITTVSVNKPRDQWNATQTSLGQVTLTFPTGSSIPAGALYRNVYVAIASTGGSIQDTDMLQLASKLDLATATFVDNGTLDINLGSVPPQENATEGPRVDNGIVEDGNPILYTDIDNPYNVYIGGGGPNAMHFDTASNGYKAQPQLGTNYYPSVVVGFRNNTGSPALTMLYSNTEGISKQAILEQQTVNYGSDQSFTVWGITEQHYGAAGVAAPNSAINYLGKLAFLSTDGFTSMETSQGAPNVLTLKSISKPIDPYVRAIKNDAAATVIGAGWNGKFMWTIPNAGFDTPQQIGVLDTNLRGVEGDGAWYTLNIPANWIGVVSPQGSAAFVYVSQGNHTYKLMEGQNTYDVKGGVNVPFSTSATGTLAGMYGSQAHNVWQASVQAMFYIVGVVGTVTIGVNYRNQNGKPKTKRKVLVGPSFIPSSGGGYGDPQWTYANFPVVPGFKSGTPISGSKALIASRDIREPVRIDDIMNEAQWFIQTDPGYNDYLLRGVSYEGINLGIRPDLQ